jgi:acyl-CoA thioester hydrolase
MNKPYFPARPGDPEPLRRTVTRRVRFEEVDSLGIVWHGRYASYFEDARDALGEAYGIAYMDFYHRGVVVPIKKIHVDFHRPLRFRVEARIEAALRWSEAARMNYEFVIRDGTGRVAATGYTVQMMLDLQDNLCMIPPPFYADFLERWKTGKLEKLTTD